MNKWVLLIGVVLLIGALGGITTQTITYANGDPTGTHEYKNTLTQAIAAGNNCYPYGSSWTNCWSKSYDYSYGDATAYAYARMSVNNPFKDRTPDRIEPDGTRTYVGPITIDYFCDGTKFYYIHKESADFPFPPCDEDGCAWPETTKHGRITLNPPLNTSHAFRFQCFDYDKDTALNGD